jgi:hypothetical protein
MAKRKRSTVTVVKETPITRSAESPKNKRAKPEDDIQPKAKVSGVKIKDGVEGLSDPEVEGEELADEEELKEALSRTPAVNSDYLPLPWKGRLGYVGFVSFSKPS